MSRSIRFRPQARLDLQQIWRFTADQWDVEQADAYIGEIELAIRKIAENPALGSARDDLLAGLRKAVAGSHRVYYLFDQEAVDVVRILHGSMDAGGALQLLSRETK